MTLYLGWNFSCYSTTELTQFINCESEQMIAFDKCGMKEDSKKSEDLLVAAVNELLTRSAM